MGRLYPAKFRGPDHDKTHRYDFIYALIERREGIELVLIEQSQIFSFKKTLYLLNNVFRRIFKPILIKVQEQLPCLHFFQYNLTNKKLERCYPERLNDFKQENFFFAFIVVVWVLFEFQNCPLSNLNNA